MRRSGWAIAIACSTASGCTCGSREPAPSAASAAVPSASVAAPPKKLAPLEAESWRIDLPVEGFEPASVAVPLGARQPRPVVIALHGIADRAEWQCGTWTGIAGGRTFVLCPRGVRKGRSETWAGSERTIKELRAGLEALKRRFRDHVAPGPVVLTGYSLGATHAVQILKQEPSFFSRVVLVEGGHEAFTATIAAVFARGGGKRVLFACGQAACETQAERRLVFVRRAGAEAELVSVPGVGHALDGRMAKGIREKWAWLVSGDPRFQPEAP